MYRNRIAIDLAKDVFQIAVSPRPGDVSSRKRLTRPGFSLFLRDLPEPTELVMEACGSAHYWGRVAMALGHTVTLIHAAYAEAR